MFRELDSDTLETAREAIRFAVIGGTGLLVNTATLILLVEVVQVPEKIAAIFSTLLILGGGFIATNWWVFESINKTNTTKGLLKRGSSYYAVMLTGKAINYGIYVVLLSFNIWYPLAWFMGSLTVFVGTFLSNRLIWYKLS
jgi:putative flippase GtrA